MYERRFQVKNLGPKQGLANHLQQYASALPKPRFQPCILHLPIRQVEMMIGENFLQGFPVHRITTSNQLPPPQGMSVSDPHFVNLRWIFSPWISVSLHLFIR